MLRELLWEIGFKGDAKDVIKMDSAVDDLKENSESASDSVKGLEDATDELGETTKKSGGLIQDNWKAISVGLLAVGAGIESLARKNQSTEVSLKKLSAQTGESTESLRKLAIETSNVTFPMDEVISLMETGRKQGIKSTEQLQEYAQFWDMVGDATGESGPALGEASAGLRAVGIAAGEESKAINAFGYLTENTTQNIGEFLTVLERSAPQVKEMGLSIDDTAALMGAMEKQGITGRTAISEFTKAINNSDGEMNTLISSLGLTNSEFKAQKTAINESSDVLERNAGFLADSYTSTQKLGHWVSELSIKYGEQIHVLSNLVPLISTIGPLMKVTGSAITFFSTMTLAGMKAALISATATVWAFTAALLANPITWIVLAIGALIASLVLLWKNWDSVTNYIKGAMEVLKDTVGNILGWIKNAFDSLNPIGWGKNIIDGLIGGLTGGIKKLKDTVGNIGNTIGGGVKKFFGINSPSKLMTEYGVNINDGLAKGMDKSIPSVENTTNTVSDAITPQSSGGNFSPTLNITVNGSNNAQESVRALKQEWEKLMAQYKRRTNLQGV